VDDRYLDSPYYIAPTEKVGQEAFAVIRDAIKRKGMAALGRVVLARRERLIMLEPWKKGLLGITLRYPYEVRDDVGYFEEIPDSKVSEEMLELADHIVDTKASRPP
jgi:DNA end-binding protein Ku